MIKRGTILINYLDSIGQFSASHSAHRLFVYADIEDHRELIDSAAQGRQEPFKEWFGGQERIYLPFGENKSQSEDKEVSLRKEFPDILKWIKEYLKEDPEEASLLQGRTGSGRKLGGKFFSQILRRRLAEFYSRNSQKITMDQGSFTKLFSGHFTGNYEDIRPGAIGSFSGASAEVLSAEKEHNIFSGEEFDKVSFLDKLSGIIEDANIISKDFLNSPIRGNKNIKEYSVVISSNPTDVAAMSTGRKWTSCMNLDGGGSHSSDVFCEIKAGAFVAYLISKEDKDINKPLARLRARRFDNAEGKAIAILEDEVYSDGTDYPGFEGAVQSWIDNHQGTLEYGTYYRRGGEWSDSFGQTHDVQKEYPKDIKSLSEIYLDPNKTLEGKIDTYILTDNLWDNYNDKLWDYVDDVPDGNYLYEESDKLDISHLPDEGMSFPTEAAATEWVKSQNNYWKYELSDYVEGRKEEFGIEIEDEEENEELSPWDDFNLTGEGETLMEFANGTKERYSVRIDTAQEKAERERKVIANHIYRSVRDISATRSKDKENKDKESIPKELILKLISEAKTDSDSNFLTGHINSRYKLKTYAELFPEYFSKEELLELLSGEHGDGLESLSIAYSSMKDSPERDSMREMLLSQVEQKLDYKTLRLGYERYGDYAAQRSGFGNPHKPIYQRRLELNIIRKLSEGSPLPNSFSDKFIEIYNLAGEDVNEKEDDLSFEEKIKSIRENSYKEKDDFKLTEDSSKRLQLDMIFSLKAMNAHNPRTISFYNNILKDMKIESISSMSDGLSGHYLDIGAILYAISDVGISGTPLIPEIERLFKEADAYVLTEKDKKEHALFSYGEKTDKEYDEILQRVKHSFKRRIIATARGIRGQS